MNKLITRKVYETQQEKTRDFWIGFVGWHIANFLIVVVGAVLVYLSGGPGDVLLASGRVLRDLVPWLVNIVGLIYFAFTRKSVAMGGLSAIAVFLGLMLCYAIFAFVTCSDPLGLGIS